MNRTIPTTPALTGHPSARRRSLRHAAPALVALWTLCAALLAIAAASCTADPFDGRHPDDATDPDVLTFAVSPRPAFTEATVSGEGTAAPATRAELTDDGTHWQTGDILWLDVAFYKDKQDLATLDTVYFSALKYDVDEWRYLTEAEAEALNTGNIPGFSRLVRWPRKSKDWVAPGMAINAFYAGSGKPDADGTITIIPTGEIPTTPIIGGRTDVICSPDVKPVPLELTYGCSRIRIPAGYKVELTKAQYRSRIVFSFNRGISITLYTPSEIPAQSEATDVFLYLAPGGTSTAKLTRDGVSPYTFTFPRITDAEGNLTHNGVSYTLTPYTSGTETPVADYDLTVATETDLRNLAQAVNAGDTLPNGKPAAEARVLQTANIGLTKEWVPIGNRYDNPFRGAYNGNGHEITGLTIRTTTKYKGSSYAGLFGSTEGAVLTGIKLREVKINIPQDSGEMFFYVGSIAGELVNSTLSLCSADGTVNADCNVQYVYAGGIAGISTYSTISRCQADVETKATTTNRNGGVRVGGIAGVNNACSFILSCEAQGGAVFAQGSSVTYAGGITGQNQGQTVFCRTGGNTVTAQYAYGVNCAGGLAGSNGGFLYSCYSRATVKATGGVNAYAGVIVGNKAFMSGGEQHCYATGAADKGTSDLDPDLVLGIVYNANPDPGEIFGVMTNYPGKVESLTDPRTGTPCYPYTTHYNPSATPAYGIIPQRAVWKSDGAWNIGDGTYPKLNIDEYEGK